MSDRQWPATIIGTAWLTYDPEDGWSEHDNPADAEREFGAIVDHLRDEASEGWHESADTAAWGIWIPIERLRLCATAWPDDGTEDGERCKDAGWDAFLSGNPEKVEIDAAAIDFCVRREAAAFAAMRERVEALEAERDEARAILADIADTIDPGRALATVADLPDIVDRVRALLHEREVALTEVDDLQSANLRLVGACNEVVAERVAERDALRADLDKANDRLVEARGYLAVHTIPALECDEAMADVVAEIREWLGVDHG